jgi:hypothetical protein
MLQNEELHNVVMTVKFRRIREDARIACMGGTRQKSLVGKPGGKKTLGMPM